MNKFAVIRTGGKQYKVSEGDILEVEKLDVEDKKVVKFDDVLMVSDGKEIKVGTPKLESVVEAVVLEQTKGEKIKGFTYKAKSRYRRRYGHRQKFTKVEIKKIK